MFLSFDLGETVKQRSVNKILKKIKDEIDDYEMTVGVVKVFGHEMIWSAKNKDIIPGAIFWCGRRMTTSATNKISPSNKITPDIVIRINGKIGTVAEVKQSLPKNQDHWRKPFNQLIKYDDELAGWFPENNDTLEHDIVLLIPDHLSVQIEDYVRQEAQNGLLNFKRNFAMVAYHRTTRSQEFISLRKFFGSISDAKKDEELRLVKLIPISIIFAIYNFFFIDQRPPLPYIMNAVWEQIANYIDIDKVIEDSDSNNIQFSLQKMIHDLKQANFADGSDPRNPSLPRSKWIRQAIDKLVEEKFLIKRGKNSYHIPLKKYQRLKEPLDTFSKKLAKSMADKENQKKQLPLFGK